MAFHRIPSDFIALLNITQLVRNSFIEYCIIQLAGIVIESWTASHCPPCDSFGTDCAHYRYPLMDRSLFLPIDQASAFCLIYIISPWTTFSFEDLLQSVIFIRPTPQDEFISSMQQLFEASQAEFAQPRPVVCSCDQPDRVFDADDDLPEIGAKAEPPRATDPRYSV
jgi:hypothetical protein